MLLSASERSERDTFRGNNTIENRGCLFIGERDTYRGNTIENRGCLFIWRASEASETLSGVTQSRFRFIYWRASVASETLTGVTQSKIGDVCWRASETVLGVDNAKSGIYYIYIMYVCMDGTYALKTRARGTFFS